MAQAESVRELDAFGETIEYRIIRSKDATEPRIDVDLHEVKVVIPAESGEDPEALVQENARWIVGKKRKYDRHREKAPERRFEVGEEFPYLGDSLEVVVEDVERSMVSRERFILSEARVESSSIREELEDLYRRKAREHFKDRVETFAEEMGVEYDSIAVRNQRTRWGSCSPKENLSFNWRLMMAPAEVLDYVIVHELAHLKETNHTRRFWRIVREHCEGYKKFVSWLEENSATLTFSQRDL